MGNFNNNHGQKRKKKSNNGYFARNTQQFGENFISNKTARDINREYRNIFKDIAYSFPDEVQNFSKHFLNSTFVYNLNNAAYIEWAKNNAISLGLQTYIKTEQDNGAMIDPSMKLDEALYGAQRSTEAYFIICDHMNNMLNLFEQSSNQEWLLGNIENYLKSLSNRLAKFKMDI